MSIVKFKVVFVSNESASDKRLGVLSDWCRRFNESGLTPLLEGTGRSLGNLSFRCEPGNPVFVITASGLESKKELKPDDFVRVIKVDPKQKIVFAEGKKVPSMESMMHYEIYTARKDVGAIFHGHDRKITSCACLLGLPETAKEKPPGTVALLKEVVKILDKENFLIMKNHGFLALGKSMNEAGNLALQTKKKVLSKK